MRDDSRHDVGGDLIPALVKSGDAHVYDFTTNEVPGVTEREHAYWRDVGSVDAYHEAHMDLVSVNPVFNLYNQDWPIYTSDITAPPAKVVAVAEFGAGQVADSMLSAGAVISGAYVRGSVLSPWVRVEAGGVIDNSVILEDVVVEPGARIRNAIIDKGVVVPAGYEIGYDTEQDTARGFTVTEGGIVAIPKNEVLG